MTRKKPPPFQNIDLMQPRSGRSKHSGACDDPPHTHVTAEVPDQPGDHIVGSEGCYSAHHFYKSPDDY